jgi:hypothetical protein
MVEHIVLFKWREDAAPADIARAVQGLKGLREEIGGIVDLTIGDNFSSRSQGFQCALVIRFENRRAVEEYGPHPAHQSVVQNLINPIRVDTIVVDYEF